MQLRAYQEDSIKRIFGAWGKGHRSVLFQMPTGTGKTVVFSEIARRGHERERKIVIIAHRKELIEQIQHSLRRIGISSGLILAGHESDPSQLIQIASIQTLSRRDAPEANLVIIDEAHHAKANSYKRLWELFPEAKFLGVTATPCRTNGDGLGELFDEIILSEQIKEFIERGDLCKTSHFICSYPDVDGIRISKGDYEIAGLRSVMSNPEVMAGIVESYLKHCPDKSAIIFGVDIEHSKAIAENFRSKGVIAVHLDSMTPIQEREKILREFKAKKIKVVTNVEIITEGFDFPECEAVILARPTKSLTLYLQMVGRVMRTAGGKEKGIVLDNAGLCFEHGNCTMDRIWSLNGRQYSKKKLSDEEDLFAKDEEGNIYNISRRKPIELEGLEMIELSETYKTYYILEKITNQIWEGGYKIIRAWYLFLKEMRKRNKLLSLEEFNTIKNYLNNVNAQADLEQRFKPGAWYYWEKDLVQCHRYQELRSEGKSEEAETLSSSIEKFQEYIEVDDNNQDFELDPTDDIIGDIEFPF